MSTTTDLSTLKINYLTQAQYDTALTNNQINANELYFTPHDTKSEILNLFYPVGTIYQTVDSTFSPQTSWGGTWVLLQGAFLVGATNINDSTVYNHTSTTVAASANYTIPITLTTGDIFTITTSDGTKDTFQYHVERMTDQWKYFPYNSIWYLQNTSGSSVTIVECAKGFGSSSTSATTAVGGQANVKLTGNESGVASHTHSYTPPVISTYSGGAVNANYPTTTTTPTTGNAGAWGFRSSALLPRTGATGLVGTESNVTLSNSSTTRYSISNNSNTTAKTAGSIEDTVNYAGHAHTIAPHKHTISMASDGSVGDVSSGSTTVASQAHDNIPPYIPVYTWKRTA